MDEEIAKLQERIQELEQKKKEEEERNKDPFRYLRERIARRKQQLEDFKQKLQKVNFDESEFPRVAAGSRFNEIEIRTQNACFKQEKKTHNTNIEYCIAEIGIDTSILEGIENLQAEISSLRYMYETTFKKR